MLQLQDTVAVVTGAGRGIGRAVALALAEAGADVVLAARSVAALEEVAAEVKPTGRHALVVPTDLKEEAAVRELARRTLDEFGRVDTLVNNSGIGGPSAPLWEIPIQEWEETFAVNVTGTFLCCQAFLPAMIERRRGSIVIIGSMTGKRPMLNRSPYAASKLALVGLARTLAAEAGPHGIRVNVISPGPVEGERIEWVLQKQAETQGITVAQARENFQKLAPLERLVDPRDIAHATVFLASEAAAAITGEDLNVSAGVVMY